MDPIKIHFTNLFRTGCPFLKVIKQNSTFIRW